MPPEGVVQTPEQEFFEALFRQEYHKLLRYATVILRKYGAKYVSDSGRAEDVVQETFKLAWKKRDELMKKEFPAGWLYMAAVCKAREALREDRAWVKRLALVQQAPRTPQEQGLTSDLKQLLLQEEYDLLCKLYLEGYSYKELCAELGVKKSTLAMRVKRSKEKIQKKYEDF